MTNPGDQYTEVERGLAAHIDAWLDVHSGMARLGVQLSIGADLMNAVERLGALRDAHGRSETGRSVPPEVVSVRSDTTAMIEKAVKESTSGLVTAAEVLKQMYAGGWTTDSARPGNLITSALGRLADDPASSVTRVTRGKYRWGHTTSDAEERADSSSVTAEDDDASVNPTLDEGRESDGPTQDGGTTPE